MKDPSGRPISETDLIDLLWEDTHDLADTRLGPLRIYTRWWGEDGRPWLTRAWVGGTLVGKQWSASEEDANRAHMRWTDALFTDPPLPLPHPRRTRTLPAPADRTGVDPYGTPHSELLDLTVS